MSPITILGAGSWGTALAVLLARNGQQVFLWGRDSEVREMQTSRCNRRYLPDVVLSDQIEILTDFKAAVANVEDILIAIPSHAFRSVVTNLLIHRSEGIRLAWATKGLDAQNNQLLHEVVFELFSPQLPIAILAGPSFAKEVAAGLPTAVTLTSNNAQFERDLIARLHAHHFRVYKQPDLVGVQISGAIKNCLAVATGISDGLGYGTNARSALMTRGLVEMTRLGLAMGGQQETFTGLAGLGDLILTCTDDQSRNRRFGLWVGRGDTLEEAERKIGQVVEGKSNAFKVLALARSYQVEMPLIEQVCAVLEGKISPYQSVETLFARQVKGENV